ncbi:cytochrome P450 [Antrihabitans sp. YC2-6]|uniref:cytochrome P450 n=1 Tax=Antrihabitans sp. YC2-6 TaxID=2799498 RepID=UPI0018F342E3|nr:cytochrome P450 [Antrihabitans sp. YC2-6]MBJ8346176.1 cytochrome P450 [Antrihabitans sp. YC2-6]
MTARLSELPTAPGRLPLLGHSLSILRNPLEFIGSLSGCGEVVRIYLGPKPAYLVTTAELIRYVSLNEDLWRRDELAESIKEICLNSVNILTGKEHELRRRMIAPAFKQARLADYAVVTAEIANKWAAELPGGQDVNLMESIHGLVLETVSSTLFRGDFTEHAKEQIRIDIPWLLTEVVRRGSLPAAVRKSRLIANSRFARRSRRLRAAIREVVVQYRLDDQDRGDVLSALIRHTDKETGATLSDEEIIDELILVMAGGVGSQASLLGWIIYETLANPAVAAQVYEEIDAVVGFDAVRAEHVPELPYLRTVLLETLRMWAPWVSTRTANGPVSLGGFTLPDGATIAYSPYMIHRDDTYYENANRHDPERWSPENIARVEKRTSLTFGIGPRRCPGNHYSVLAITLQAAAFFAYWRPELDTTATVSPSNKDFVLSPSQVPLHLVRR